MSKRNTHTFTANKGNIVVPTGFRNYDFCINPYVGCRFGCAYCYVRFTAKDTSGMGLEWGEYVRVREHISKRLPKELSGEVGKYIPNSRIVLGTMTDPYQPLEKKYRLTRQTLRIIRKYKVSKVGIFTRSPIITDDIKLISSLPRSRVHFTVSPHPASIMTRIEPIAIRNERRWETIQKIKEAGIRVHCNISPCLPLVSEQFIEEFVSKITEIGVDEFFVDPFMAYAPALDAMSVSLGNHEQWNDIVQIVTNRRKYLAWKSEFREKWVAAWAESRHKSPNTLPIWADHENKVWEDMNTGQQMDPKLYGDDA